MISERAFSRSFDSFWRELLPLLNPGFVSLFNEAYERVLIDSTGADLQVIPVPAAVKHPDLVAELAFRLARLAHLRGEALELIDLTQAIVLEAEVEALVLVQKYEGDTSGKGIELSQADRSEGLRICSRYSCLYSAFPTEARVEFCPQFRGAGFVDSCEGDLGVSNCLIEVKTTIRKPLGRDLRQILTYLALDANAGTKRWQELGLFNPQRGTFHRADIDSLVLRLSGGRPPSDVFADLISFVESHDLISDTRF